MNSIHRMFTFVIVFWLVLFSVFGFIGAYAVNIPSEYGDDTLNVEQKNSFQPLFIVRVMFFSLPPEYEVPSFIGIILNAMLIFSLYVIVQTFNPLGNA